MRFIQKYTLLLLTLFGCMLAQAKPLAPAVQHFVDQVALKHHLSKKELDKLLSQAVYRPGIIKAMTRPYEAKPWYQYRKHFITKKRIDGGVRYWRKYRTTLKHAEKKYGVPVYVIVALTGVETLYGKNRGHFRTLDALYTLAFHYPRRAHFFQKELENYILMLKEQNLSHKKVQGSYAGAIGIPQFMPSSYRRYAIDFDHKHHADLANNHQDAIYSIANYLKQSGWQRHQPIFIAAKPVTEARYQTLHKQYLPLNTFYELGVVGLRAKGKKNKAELIQLPGKKQMQYWLVFANFKAIMRYNPRHNYAMAVAQLAKAIRQAYQQQYGRR